MRRCNGLVYIRLYFLGRTSLPRFDMWGLKDEICLFSVASASHLRPDTARTTWSKFIALLWIGITHSQSSYLFLLWYAVSCNACCVSSCTPPGSLKKADLQFSLTQEALGRSSTSSSSLYWCEEGKASKALGRQLDRVNWNADKHEILRPESRVSCFLSEFSAPMYRLQVSFRAST
jgi:hypothetical protein